MFKTDDSILFSALHMLTMPYDLKVTNKFKGVPKFTNMEYASNDQLYRCVFSHRKKKQHDTLAKKCFCYFNNIILEIPINW